MAACATFFALDEMVLHLLFQADATTLFKCYGLCQKMHHMIEKSEELQRNMFLLRPHDVSPSDDFNISLNPYLFSLFGITTSASSTTPRDDHDAIKEVKLTAGSYHSLHNLPWARQGVQKGAAARQAFTRPEASWRHIYVSQPPMMQLHWTHRWWSTNTRTVRSGVEVPLNRGSGKRRADKVSITMGMAWDLVEALLLRECTVELSFVIGEDTSQAQASRSNPNRWRAPRVTPISFELQRLIITSEHVWPNNGPSIWERFDVPTMTWQISDDPPPSADTEEARH